MIQIGNPQTNLPVGWVLGSLSAGVGRPLLGGRCSPHRRRFQPTQPATAESFGGQSLDGGVIEIEEQAPWWRLHGRCTWRTRLASARICCRITRNWVR